MARRRYGARVSRETPRRKFVWVRHIFAGTQTGAASGSDLLSQFEVDYGAQLIGCTIVRIRGIMFAGATEGLVNSADSFRYGARVVGGTGVDLSGPVPDYGPFADPNADWMLWEPFMTILTPAISTAPTDLIGRRVDVKASRKLEELGERLVLFQEGNPGAPTVNWAVGWDLSIGVKLP